MAAVSAPQFITFGCRLNAYETEVMRRNAAAAGVERAVVVNTCAVTAEAERQARQAIRKARRDHPDARIIVTGCAAQIAPERYAAMAEVDQVLGNEAKLDPAIWRRDEPMLVDDIMAVRETAGHLVEGLEGRTRAFVQVQNGCDHRCTFCIIPYGRGASRSVPVGEVVQQVRTLVGRGYREVVLTGVDLTSYGADLPGAPRLGQLVRRLLRLVPALDRLRLSSLDPAEIDDDLWRALADEPRLMPHLHLSLQAGDDMVLKRMKRRHSAADATTVVDRARALRPDVVFGADLIAGFPTETEAMAANTLALVEALDLTWLHVFPYSARQGTPAARMPQVPAPMRKARAAALRAAGDAAVARHLAAQVGRTVPVLMETDGLGRTAQFAPVAVADAGAGALLPVRIVGLDGGRLVGRALAAAA
ncbi:MAG: tRNA (N(6)-L-threonylcarbamoyladenosine(37)-C(2))-methylthiotransferase MtaB [Alphaproteobacteria bacterium]